MSEKLNGKGFFGTTLIQTKHAGEVVEQIVGFKAKCACRKRFGGRIFRFKATEDLLAHYREVGTMREIQPIESHHLAPVEIESEYAWV